MTLHMGSHFNDVEQILNDSAFQERMSQRRSYNDSRMEYVQQEQSLPRNGYGQQRPPSTTNFTLGPPANEYKVSRSYPGSTSGQDQREFQKSPLSVMSAPDNNQDVYANQLSNQGITTIPKGNCAACRNPVNGQIVIAAGHVWHPEHFTCAKCNDELGHRSFFEKSGKIYCDNDYYNAFYPHCAYCNGPIKDRVVNALDKTWHAEHFCCAACGRAFNDEGYHEKDGQAYCKKDFFAMFAPKCATCNRPVSDNFVTAWKSYFHRECFTCAACKKPFNGEHFFELDGQPYCELHYHEKRGSLCAVCNKPISGRRIMALKRSFHPEHFTCAVCHDQLNKRNFKEVNGKPLCQNCFSRIPR